jgi:hypothetical protein
MAATIISQQYISRSFLDSVPIDKCANCKHFHTSADIIALKKSIEGKTKPIIIGIRGVEHGKG